MKNLFKIIAVAAFFFFGMQNTTAQSLQVDQQKPEEVAKTKTAELHKELGLTGDQQRYIFRALTANEVNMRKNIQGRDANNPDIIATKKKYEDALVKSMRKTLTPEQFVKWEAMQKQ